ncbi:unnamed protein product [Brassica oleracea var. botrytis]|uniref:(rape) hypothetical protein n=1 Tax=Brassica napus TaxID=3708 RepID=A0A816RG63_BRANA|nr:unnamed protein product [Brassica napus]
MDVSTTGLHLFLSSSLELNEDEDRRTWSYVSVIVIEGISEVF